MLRELELRLLPADLIKLGQAALLLIVETFLMRLVASAVILAPFGIYWHQATAGAQEPINRTHVSVSHEGKSLLVRATAIVTSSLSCIRNIGFSVVVSFAAELVQDACHVLVARAIKERGKTVERAVTRLDWPFHASHLIQDEVKDLL